MDAGRPTNATTLIAPVDYVATETTPNWRARLAWPIRLADAYALGRHRLRRVVSAVAAMPPGDARLIAMASCGQVIAVALPLIELAVTNEAAHRQGVTFVGEAESLHYLQGKVRLDRLSAFAFRRPHNAPRHARLRRWARAKSWTPWHRLGRALVYPRAIAIAHNELLHEAAATDGLTIGFYHAESFLAAGRRSTASALGEEACIEAAAVLGNALGPYPEVGAHHAERLVTLLSVRIEAITRVAAADLGGMRSLRRLPGSIWAGSGGHWPTRITALEALRRGGEVTLFDHGHNRALHDILEFPASIDLFAASTLVIPTPAMADRMRGPQLRALLPRDRSSTIVSRRGDHGLAEFVRSTQRPARFGARPRVLYAPHILRGLRQTVPASLPDLVYLDWQLRLVEGQSSAPVELLVRPHPQGIFAGKPHPLGAITATEGRRFEALVPEADVLLFDSPYSRVFCKALLTDRPIVFIDFGAPYFGADIAPLIERRCHVLKVENDERNLPQLPPQTLTDALCTARRPPDDTVAFFRRLMIGEAP
jgi:hypothetical protein